MKNLIVAVLVGLFAVGGYAQLTEDGTGARTPGNLTKQVPVFIGADSDVVSFTGSAGRKQVTTGRGVLTGITLQHVTSAATAVSLPFNVELFDLSSTNQSYTTYGAGARKLVADPIIGYPIPALSNGWTTVGYRIADATTAVSFAGPGTPMSNYVLPHPVKFNKGIVMVYPAAANSAAIGIHWVK